MIKLQCNASSGTFLYPIRFICAGWIWIAMLLMLGTTSFSVAQNQVMEVAERGEEGKATRINLDLVGVELPNLLKWLSKETDLSIIANQQDIEGKKFSLTNLKNVTIDEALEHIKTVLMQYNLTTIRTNRTLLITTMEKATQMKVPVYVLEDVQKFEEIQPSDQVVTQVIILQNASAADLVNNLKPLVAKSANLFADENSNALVITDVASNIQRLASILKVVDQTPQIEMKLKVYQLQNASARSLSRTLEQLFREEAEVTNMLRKIARRPDPERLRKAVEMSKGIGLDLITGRIQIAADEDSNVIIVKASEETLLFMDMLIEQLDRSGFIQPEIKIFTLDYAIADDVQAELEQLLQGGSRRPGRSAPWWERRRWEDERRRKDEEGGGASKSIVGEVNITSDDRLNAILISSDPRNFPIIEKIITELDQPDPKEEIKMFYLKYADAEDVVQNLQDLVEGNTGGRDMPWWARFERRMRQQEMGTNQTSGIQGPVNMVADTRLNAVLVSTASVNMPMIDQLIGKLDENKPEQEWSTKIRTLEYADAENIADLINTIFQGSNRGGGGFFFFIPRFNQRNQTQGSLAGNVRAEAYPTLNALILSASTARNFELLNEFVDSVDVPTPEGQKEITRPIRLEYADAQQLSDLLGQVWEGESQRGFSFSRFFARGGTPEQKDINSLRGKVTVFADSQTNSLIITTQERYWEDAEALIKNLDVVRGQVWMDIEILEITLDDETKFGIETTVEERGLLGVEHRAKNPLVGTVASQLGLADEVSGFSYTLATKEYMALIHALRSENKVKTISRPSFLTRDNQPASFSRGKRLPYLRSSQQNLDFGRQTFDYDYLENPVGVTINVTPHIARSVSLNGQARTIGLDFQQITVSNLIEFTSFNAPITEDSDISAYIDVKDGQTIIIGGMTRNNEQDIVEQVPILGSIPIIGRLFKSTDKVMETTEIVIMITPHIVDIKREVDSSKELDDIQKLQQNDGGYQKQWERMRDFKEGKLDRPNK